MISDSNPLVSIIMPAYNAEKTLAESVESVINQTYKDWVLFILDDGSKDKTGTISMEYSKLDERILYLPNEKNIGVSQTRNRGINLSKSDWIAFLDSDDMWEKTKLEEQIGYCIYNDSKFSFTGSKYINENGEYYPGIFKVPYNVDYEKLKRHNVISTSSVLIHKDLIGDDIMEFDYLHEDYLFWLKILRKGYRATALNKPMLIYRLSKSSKSGNKLKSIKMTSGVFRKLEYGYLKTFLYTTSHLFKASLKYKNIYSD